MFDKMFKNKKSIKDGNSGSQSESKINLVNQNMDLINFDENSNQVTSYDLDNYNMNFQTQTRATFSP